MIRNGTRMIPAGSLRAAVIVGVLWATRVTAGEPAGSAFQPFLRQIWEDAVQNVRGILGHFAQFNLLSLFMLCAWSCIVIVIIMIARKYDRTRMQWGVAASYVAGGLGSCLCALLYNGYLFNATGVMYQAGAYDYDGIVIGLVSASVGEEFWKLAAGAVVTVVLLGQRRNVGDHGRILGFVVIGCTFATAENMITYASELSQSEMLMRAVTAVPLHACMGVVHGKGVNAALRPGRRLPFLPLILAFVVAAFFHALYNTSQYLLAWLLSRLDISETWPSLIADLPPGFVVGPIVFVLTLWAWNTWRNLPETTADPALQPGEDLDWVDTEW